MFPDLFQHIYLSYLIFSVGLNFTDDDISEMVQEADIDGDQHISFDEFRDIFFESWEWCQENALTSSPNLINLQSANKEN